MKPRLLIVDDDETIRTQMKWALASDYEVLLAENRAEALEMFRSRHPAVTMLDLGLPPRPNEPEEGLAALSELLALDSSAKVITISGQGEKENAIQAVGAGAYDFLCKPVNLEEVRLLLRRCFYVTELEREYHEMEQSFRFKLFEGMLGPSDQMQSIFALIRKVAPSNVPVLLLGESGTGKELTALAIHRRSTRKAGPFVAINCNAISESLLESELFGHEKGSFTGAHVQRKGLIESAAGGTLFLDEIGELRPPIQVKLLRFLQDRRFQRVGGRQELLADVRIVAATNADLAGAIAKGTFREDLYFRLAVVVINLPPLRQRGDDLSVAARAFLERFAEMHGKPGLTYAPETVRALARHTWPGNLRELQNRVQRAVIMADGKRVTVKDMELIDVEDVLPKTTLKEARESVEKEMVSQALKRHAGKVSLAAAELGVTRPTFYELMEKLGIARE
jgi:two-component system, NtrC family, response regulator